MNDKSDCSKLGQRRCILYQYSPNVKMTCHFGFFTQRKVRGKKKIYPEGMNDRLYKGLRTPPSSLSNSNSNMMA